MLKALLKKQFLELSSFLFRNRKTGKRRSKGGLIGYAILYIGIFGLLGASLFMLGSLFATTLLPLELDWLYFAMMGLLTLLMGVLGDVFNTYAGLYHAKDNELLLSMPIPPAKILLARMTGVYGMALLYGGLVYVPATIAYWIWCEGITAAKVLGPVVMFIFLALLITVLSCILGWVVALIAGKVKNKSFVTVLASLISLALYYAIYFRLYTYLQDFLLHVDEIRSAMGGIYPLYLLGKACSGEGRALLIGVTAIAAAFALTYYIMQRSFLYIATHRSAEKKTVYREKAAKVESAQKALIRKELRRFLSSPTYVLNCGMGLVLALALAVFALIRLQWLQDMVRQITMQLPVVGELLPLAVVVGVGMLSGMNDISAASVSLEGKSIWLMQSLPVTAQEVLKAKYKFCMYMNMAPTLFLSVVMTAALNLNFAAGICTVVFALLLVMLNALGGLALNLKHPNLSWTNEVVPVKQGASVAFTLFGGWVILLAYGAGGYFLRNMMDIRCYLLAGIVLAALGVRLVNKWLMSRGAEIFANL